MERSFDYSFQLNGCKKIQFSVLISLPLPSSTSASEQLAMLCSTQKVPCYARQDLKEKLDLFIFEETQKYLDDRAESFVENFLSLPLEEAEKKLGNVAARYAEEHKGYGPSQPVENDDLFSDVYQSLLHSSNPCDIQALLSKGPSEQTLALHVHKLIRERNWEIDRLKKEHAQVVENATKDSEKDQDVAKHFQKIHSVEQNYASQLCSLMESQRGEYRDLVLKLHEDQILSRDTHHLLSHTQDLKSEESERPHPDRPHAESFSSGGRPEESFTIYLGAQMKTMHNLRLSAMSGMELCGRRASTRSMDESRRLQMALSLYSNQLSGVVLLVDSRPNHHITYQTDFSKACEQSTELHFDSLEKQLEGVERETVRANECRASESRPPPSGVLRTGDVYVTRHSNLSQVHVAFHMVGDEALRSQDINSRHPCVNGLRNVIRLCSKFGVTTISLPLLLINKMSEEMTILWCLKRAELVFKCVKGFLMEGAALGGTSSGNFGSGHHLFYNVQFFVPPEISPDVFGQITEMLPTIYHLVNPVTEKS